jgi:hypothetical protein
MTTLLARLFLKALDFMQGVTPREESYAKIDV